MKTVRRQRTFRKKRLKYVEPPVQKVFPKNSPRMSREVRGVTPRTQLVSTFVLPSCILKALILTQEGRGGLSLAAKFSQYTTTSPSSCTSRNKANFSIRRSGNRCCRGISVPSPPPEIIPSPPNKPSNRISCRLHPQVPLIGRSLNAQNSFRHPFLREGIQQPAYGILFRTLLNREFRKACRTYELLPYKAMEN
ncbi:hypothetical protein CEXT_75851 [Caerostris extrusa]|uniref:Ribosomal protein S18 n=1 Tax=Caerostris extrusa TaxID=172846 RepID=A0AAV4WXU3_CAEEX|nr:hypothetical protein CEXT_75851 [Caerostris extrusa]